MTTAVLLQGLVSGLLMGIIYALIAVGLSVIFGIMNVVNFAHGEHLMLGMFGAYFLWEYLGLDPLLALPLLALGLGLLGALTYRFIIRRIQDAPPLVQVFTTFGLSIFLSSTAQFLWTPNFRVVQNPLVQGTFAVGAVIFPIPEMVAAAICLLAFVALHLFLQHTVTGMALRATAEDKQTAFLMGIDGERMFTLGWVIGLACVGVAGGLLAMFYYIFPTVGVSFALLAYLAVGLGGFGNIMGAFFGGALIGVVESMSGLLVSPAFKYVGVIVVYLLVVTWRPQGLAGKA